jgi:hypothetical protein
MSVSECWDHEKVLTRFVPGRLEGGLRQIELDQVFSRRIGKLGGANPKNVSNLRIEASARPRSSS